MRLYAARRAVHAALRLHPRIESRNSHEAHRAPSVGNVSFALALERILVCVAEVCSAVPALRCDSRTDTVHSPARVRRRKVCESFPVRRVASRTEHPDMTKAVKTQRRPWASAAGVPRA